MDQLEIAKGFIRYSRQELQSVVWATRNNVNKIEIIQHLDNIIYKELKYAYNVLKLFQESEAQLSLSEESSDVQQKLSCTHCESLTKTFTERIDRIEKRLTENENKFVGLGEPSSENNETEMDDDGKAKTGASPRVKNLFLKAKSLNSEELVELACRLRLICPRSKRVKVWRCWNRGLKVPSQTISRSFKSKEIRHDSMSEMRR
jgi:hypothetical protein